MNSIVIAEIVSALYTCVSLFCLFSEKNVSKSLKWMRALTVVTLLALVVDILSYAFDVVTCPAVIAYTINLLSYTMGDVMLIVFMHYCIAYIGERSKINPWYYYAPMIVAVGCVIVISWNVLSVPVGSMGDNAFTLESGIPEPVLLIQGLILVYLPIITFFMVKNLGLRTILTLGGFCFSPAIAVVVALFTGYDFSLAVGAFGIFVIATLLERYSVKMQLEAANRAKSEFLFSMSHDIRTPMNAIMGFTDIAMMNLWDRTRVKDCLEKVQHSGNLLLTLINSILDMSRIEAGKARIEEQEADMMKTFTEVEPTMQELARKNGIRLVFEVRWVEDRFVWADYHLCERIFVNLISNAIKYSKPHGSVRVSCEQLGVSTRNEEGQPMAWYRYTFEDDGIGMSEEFQQHVYEEFARERNSTMCGVQGTGLGLSLCKSFVSLLGGKISCRSKQGVGTTFVVDLPLRLRETEEEQSGSRKVEKAETPSTSQPLSSSTSQPPSFAGKRVLLVEDNELNREVASFVLKEQGLVVDTAANGLIAAEKVTCARESPDANPYDFVLMDVQMPIMDGFESTRAIREWEKQQKTPCHIPIIALSANAFEEDKESTRAAGMDDHVAKPFKIKELMEVVARFL